MQAREILAEEAVGASGDLPLALRRSRSRADPWRSAVSWLERHALIVTGLAVVAVFILFTTPLLMNQDAWLALVDGRYLAQHGIPHRDTLAVLTHGARWIDQQWLAQLAIYGLYRVGGLPLYSIANVVLAIGAFGVALAAARRLGGSEARVLFLLPLAAFFYFPGSAEIRTQGFAYPLFVAVLWLLSGEIRAPSRRRVYLVFPLLILWGNLHGSASLGVGMAVLYGVSLLVASVRSRPRRVPVRALAFVIGAPLCLLATPYGISVLSYYHETVLGSTFKAYVTEWRPVTSSAIVAVPFFVAAFATVWLLGYNRGRVRLFEALTLLMLIAGAITAIRNVAWFGLAAVMLVPAMLGSIPPRRAPAPRRSRLNLALAGGSAGALVAALLVVSTKPDSWFEKRDYYAPALARVEAVVNRHPGLHVFADIHFSDWLLWHDPALAGHIAFDARLELLTSGQLRAISNELSGASPGSAGHILAGDRLLVLEASDKLPLKERGTHVILRGPGVIVATRSPA